MRPPVDFCTLNPRNPGRTRPSHPQGRGCLSERDNNLRSGRRRPIWQRSSHPESYRSAGGPMVIVDTECQTCHLLHRSEISSMSDRVVAAVTRRVPIESRAGRA